MIIKKIKNRSKELEPLYALELSKVVIPLSAFFKSGEKEDIYNGNENIPFRKRKGKFRKLLLSEFLR